MTYSDSGLTNYNTYYFAVSSITDARSGSGFESALSRVVNAEPKWVGPLWYVDTDGGSTSGDGSSANPFREIQDAIDVVDPLSRTGGIKDTILVLPGIYDRSDDQDLYFKYNSGTTNEGQPKNLVLKSRDGAATTILDGENGRVFEIVDGTDTTLQIIGFTITASNGGGNDGGGAVVRVKWANEYYNNNTNQWNGTPSGVSFKNCVFKIFDSIDAAAAGDSGLEGDVWKDVAVDCGSCLLYTSPSPRD